MKRVIACILTLVTVFSVCGKSGLLDLTAKANTTMVAGDIDNITVNNPGNTCYGSANDSSWYGIKPDGYTSEFASVNNAVAASCVRKGWRWFPGGSSFYKQVAAIGDWIYAVNSWEKDSTPEMKYTVTAGTILEFNIGLRTDTADWSDYKIQFSSDGNKYSNMMNAAISYISADYEADDNYKTGDKKGQSQIVQVRKYSVCITENGFLKISLPSGRKIFNNTIDSNNQMNTDGDAYLGSSSFLTPAVCKSLSDANRLKAGDRDIVFTEETLEDNCLIDDADRCAYKKSSVFSKAELSDGACVTKVFSGERWLNKENAFYTEVVAEGSWLYSVNPASAETVPLITYYVTGNTAVIFQSIVRNGASSQDAITVKFAKAGKIPEKCEDLSVSDREYNDGNLKFTVRTYRVYIEENGILQIALPTGKEVSEAIVKNNNTASAEDIIYSSLTVTPALCVSISPSLNVGEKDKITVDESKTPIAGSKTDISEFVLAGDAFTSTYASAEGIAVSKVFSTWKWFLKSSLFYKEIIPASTAEKNNWVYTADEYYSGKEPNIVYGVTKDTTLKVKIALRTDSAKWSNIKILFTSDELHYNNFSNENISFVSRSYTAADVSYFGGKNAGMSHTVVVREYSCIIPSDGKVKIILPTGNQIKENIINNYLNTSGDSLKYSSVFVLPAECAAGSLSDSSVTQKENQETVLLTPERIMVYNPIRCNQLPEFLNFRNATYKIFNTEGHEITDLSSNLESKYKVKCYSKQNTVFKELTVINIKTFPYYTVKDTMQIGDYDFATWENCPQGFDELSGDYYSTSQYLVNTTLQYADVSGAMLLKNTSDWFFSPVFSVEKWDRKYGQVYCMGNQASGKEPPSIVWHVAAKSEIQIPIQMPDNCARFFDSFRFLYSENNKDWTNMSGNMLEYKQIPLEYTNYNAIQRVYSAHFAKDGYIKVIWPDRDALAAELKKINDGGDFLEAVAFIIPPRVVISSKDSSITKKDEDRYITVDESNRKISLTCLKSENLTVNQFLNRINMNNLFVKVRNSFGAEMGENQLISDGMKIECYAQGNAFYENGTLVKTYTLNINLIDRYILPEVISKDSFVTINEAEGTITVRRNSLDNIKVMQLLEMLEFKNCTYKLTVNSGGEYTAITTDVGQDRVMLVLCAKGCPGMDDGTKYKTYEIISELYENQVVFRSRNNKNVYIDEANKLIYFKNDITIAEFIEAVVARNTELTFYSVPDSDFRTKIIIDYSTVLQKGMSLSITMGATQIYYEFAPMTVVVEPAYINHIKTKQAHVIAGYDADTGYIIGLAVLCGVVILLLVAAGIVTVIMLKKRKRRRGIKSEKSL